LLFYPNKKGYKIEKAAYPFVSPFKAVNRCEVMRSVVMSKLAGLLIKTKGLDVL
jgi:hypothetical protein